MKTNQLLLLLLLSSAALILPATTTAQQQTDTAKTNINEIPASFRGGIEGWRKYLETNLVYPKKAVKKKIQGEVRVQMIVDTKGNVTEVHALNDPGGGLAAEAERVVREGPKWIPAFQNGKKVTYRFVQTITFALQ